MSEMLNVEASEDEVRHALEDVFTPEQLASWLRFERREKAADPFDDHENGEVITFVTVVIWTAQAIASGVIGGAAWDLTKKAQTAVANHLGREKMESQAAVEAGAADDK
jgi:hypothetical protein